MVRCVMRVGPAIRRFRPWWTGKGGNKRVKFRAVRDALRLSGLRGAAEWIQPVLSGQGNRRHPVALPGPPCPKCTGVRADSWCVRRDVGVTAELRLEQVSGGRRRFT